MHNLRFIAILAAFSLHFIFSGTAVLASEIKDGAAEQNRRGIQPRPTISSRTAGPVLEAESRAAEYNRKGLQYYNEAFYRQLPQGKHQEAAISFDLAATEFLNAVEANPNDPEAHRNLARLYYVRKQFSQAARVYKTLTILEPENIDTYIQLALCYTRFNQFNKAIQELKIAKTNADNPEVIAKLDEYIKRIMDHGQD